MRILYVANIRIPTEKAHGIQVMKMCEAFSAGGNDVELVVPKRRNSIQSDPYEYHGVKNIFTITQLPIIDIPNLGRFGFYLQLSTYIISLHVFLLWRKYADVSKKTVVYVRGEPILFLNYIARFIFPVFWETHIKPPKYLDAYLRSMRLAKGVVTVTDYYKHELKDVYHVVPDTLWAPDGVTLEQMEVKETMHEARVHVGFPKDKKIALYTGSFYLYDYKGVDVLIEAAQSLPNDFLVVLVGGSPRDILRIQKSGVDLSNIQLISHVPHTDIPLYLRSADVLVLPNKKGDEISEKYTSPLKLFEYMAARKPIVSSDTICLKEILNDGNAYLCEASNAQALHDGIVRAVAETEHSQKITQQAYLDVSKLTWEKRAKVISTFIEQHI